MCNLVVVVTTNLHSNNKNKNNNKNKMIELLIIEEKCMKIDLFVLVVVVCNV